MTGPLTPTYITPKPHSFINGATHTTCITPKTHTTCITPKPNHLLTGPQTVIYLAARGTFASKGSHVGCQRAQQEKLRRMVQLRPQCVPSMRQNDVADADFGPGGWLRPGRCTRERPRAVGQASATAPDGIWMLGGGYPVISATIGCQIRLDRALSRRTPGTSAFS